jgi:hypothetical protein
MSFAADGVPMHVSCEVLLPSRSGPPERFFRLTRTATPQEIIFVRPLPLEPGRRVELVLTVPGEGQLRTPAVLMSDPQSRESLNEGGGDGDHDPVSYAASLARADAPLDARRCIARYIQRRSEELSQPLAE